MIRPGPEQLSSAAVDDGTPIDFNELRSARMRKVQSVMSDLRIGLLLLGGEANIRYAVGGRRLWTAGERPWAPTCIISASGEVRLMSQYDTGVPPEVSQENLFCLTWNPANFGAQIAAAASGGIERIGLDGASMTMMDVLDVAVPGATLVDASGALLDARSSKLPAEVTLLELATQLAGEALLAASRTITPGITISELRGRLEAAIRSRSVCVPADSDRLALPVRSVSDLVSSGDAIVMRSALLHAGYEGAVTRTAVCGAPTPDHRAAERAWQQAWEALLPVFSPDLDGAGLRDALAAIPAVDLRKSTARAIGLGVERKIGGSLHPHDPLREGSVVMLELTTCHADAEVTAGCPVIVGPKGGVTMTTLHPAPIVVCGS